MQRTGWRLHNSCSVGGFARKRSVAVSIPLPVCTGICLITFKDYSPETLEDIGQLRGLYLKQLRGWGLSVDTSGIFNASRCSPGSTTSSLPSPQTRGVNSYVDIIPILSIPLALTQSLRYSNLFFQLEACGTHVIFQPSSRHADINLCKTSPKKITERTRSSCGCNPKRFQVSNFDWER